ncbi:MAG: ZIP family metal transporter [Nitrospirales bacterium]|nr:zinc transporter ZupT [Nitrospirales bacterium]
MENIGQLIGLGVIAGVFPIYLGIVLALVIAKSLDRNLEGYLTGIATGVLVYLFFDLMHEAVEQTGAKDFLSWVAFLGSLMVGYIGLVLIEQRQQGRNRTEPSKLFLPYMIALGMGLHNLGEGLAIGAAYMQGAWVLGGLLIMGFALHNGTEGFAIIGSSGKSKPGLKDIIYMGLLAGLPTCLGTVISGFAVSPYFTIMFFALAAGSLLYVILSLTTIFYTASRRVQCSWGIFTGISLMFVTAMILQMVSGIRS